DKQRSGQPKKFEDTELQALFLWRIVTGDEKFLLKSDATPYGIVPFHRSTVIHDDVPLTMKHATGQFSSRNAMASGT
ncbi:hypothetical protein ALC56_06686, partial [Trachymyrmex septentrionalis]